MNTTSHHTSVSRRSFGCAFFFGGLTMARRGAAGLALAAAVAFSGSGLRAELLVLQPGIGGTGNARVWRFDAATGSAIASFSHDNEGFYAMSVTADSEVFVTSNILGLYDLYRFSRDGAYRGTSASEIMGDFRGVMRGADGSLYCVMRRGSFTGGGLPPAFVARLDRPGGTTLIANGAGGMLNPTWLIAAPDGSLCVADRDVGVMRFDGVSGAPLGVLVPAGRGGLGVVERMIFGPDGRLYVSTGAGNSVLRYDGATGAFVDVFVAPGSGGLTHAAGLAFGPDGNLYVSSRDTHQVLRYRGDTGAFIGVFVSDSRLRSPGDLAFTRGSATDAVWFDDAPPAGAAVSGDGWAWIAGTTPAPRSGTKVLASPRPPNGQAYAFNFASPMTLGAGDTVFIHAYVDFASEIMLSWCDGAGWEHRAYWGEDRIYEGRNGTASRRYMGPMPKAGSWARLEVPAHLVGLEGRSVQGMSIAVVGAASFNRVGKGGAGATPPDGADTTPPSVAIVSPAAGATVSGNVTIAVNASDNSGAVELRYAIDSGTPTFSNSWQTTGVADGPHTIRVLARDTAGNTAEASVTVNVSNHVAPPPPPPPPPTASWVDDDIPAGAWSGGTGGDGWNWVTSNPTPAVGARAHQSNLATGLHEHFFDWAYGGALSIAASDTLFAWVYLDPANPPQQIMLSWRAENWEHRAYWGANRIGYGVDGTASRRRMGNLPAAGGWVKLTVPAEQVGLVGATLLGMSFSAYGGRVTWDAAGKVASGAGGGDSGTGGEDGGGTGSGSDAIAPVVAVTAPAALAMVSGSAVVLAVDASDNVGVASVQFRVDGVNVGAADTTAPFAVEWDSRAVANGSHAVTALATDAAGNRTTSATVIVSVNNGAAPGAVIWMDSGIPAGAWTGASGGDSWAWVTSDPAPHVGTRVHRSANVAGLHEHYFTGASSPLAVGAGDVLFVYVYLDVANPPRALLLSWFDGTWEHRAYWGENCFPYGTDGTASRRPMGALPEAGRWVQLQIPAVQIGLEGRNVSGMSFSLYDGRAAWDVVGKVR